MIEPQNTMLPVAEPRPLDAPQGEDEGFGAMLAQSLGLASQVNPNAVRQIDTNRQQGRTRQDPAGEQTAAEEQVSAQAIQSVVGGGIPVPAGLGAILDRGAGEQPPPGDDENARPVFTPTGSVGSHRFVRTEQGVAPLPTLPPPPSTEPAPHVVRPIDTIWHPSPLDDGGDVVAPDVSGGGEMTLQPVDPAYTIWKPGIASGPAAAALPVAPGDGNVVAPTQAPDVGPPDPAAGPEAPHLSVDDAAPSAPSVEPTVAGKVPVEVDRGRSIPEPPALDSRAATESADSTPKASFGSMGSPAAPTRQQVELAPDRPVRLDSVGVSRVDDRPSPGQPATPVAEPVPTDGGPGLGTVQALGAMPLSATGAAPLGMQPQASALAERVMQAIDLQRTQPPPRSMVVDIPELEGLRLVVSVRSAGHVTVTPAGNSANPDVFAPFATDLSRVLAERGFVMNGDSRRQGYNPYDQDEVPPTPRRSTGFRRPTRADNDLRI